MADGHAEPSMEDILSSIKRIIAEDSDAALAGPRAKRSVGLSPLTRPEPADVVDDHDEILELTDAVAVEPPIEPVADVPPSRPVPCRCPAKTQGARTSGG